MKYEKVYQAVPSLFLGHTALRRATRSFHFRASRSKGHHALFEFLDDPELSLFVEDFEADFPVSVSVRHDGEAGGVPLTVTDPEIIRAVFEALREISILGEWQESGHTDDSLNYYFEMADGRIIGGFVFQDGKLMDEWMGLYEIFGFDELQDALPDPGMWYEGQ